MRKSRKGLAPGLACGFGVLGASAFVLGAAASNYVGQSVISEDAMLSGVNYSSSGENEASLMVTGGSSNISSAMIVSSGSNSLGVALQNDSNLNISNSTVINSGLQGSAFLLDDSTGSLVITNTSTSSTGSLVAVQNSNASLALKGNNSANGSILVDASSSLLLNMSEGNSFIGNINSTNLGAVELSMSADSVLYLTDNSFVDSLTDEASDYSNIYLCGYTLSVNGVALEGNTADCGSLIGGYGQPTIIPDDYDPNPQPQPQPQPQPEPEPEPEPQPQPQPQSEPEPEPHPQADPQPTQEPTRYEPKIVSPNTADSINGYLMWLCIAILGLGISAAIAIKVYKKSKDNK